VPANQGLRAADLPVGDDGADVAAVPSSPVSRSIDGAGKTVELERVFVIDLPDTVEAEAAWTCGTTRFGAGSARAVVVPLRSAGG